MADLPLTEPSSELTYRPISGLALTGFVFERSIRFPGSAEHVDRPLSGIAAVLARGLLGVGAGRRRGLFSGARRVRNAEGTLAGMALARWGLWLSVLVGITYLVYTWVTGLALAKQASDFLMVKSDDDSGFFPRLMEAGKNRTELYQGFLLSLPTTSRGGSKAGNEEAMEAQYNQPRKDGDGDIDKFVKYPLVSAFARNPQIEPIGGDWTLRRHLPGDTELSAHDP